MQIGVTFPQPDLRPDVAAVREYAAGVEDLGFRHLVCLDHVLGADPAVHPGPMPYDVDSVLHEPLVLFGFLAGITSLELGTSVIIGPQRQTALLAKQAAEVDILCRGRFRLGLGVGWNAVEYEALGQDFSTRGRREEEQIELLRRLWTERSVTHQGASDTVTAAGLAPRPPQRPIPIWLGGRTPVAYRRIGRLADGWFALQGPGPELDAALAVIAEGAEAAGRDPVDLGMEGRVHTTGGDAGPVLELVDQWRAAGASHLSIHTTGAGPEVSAHLEILAEVASALDLRDGS